MTSGNLQRWISPFPSNWNMKGDCETYQGSRSTGVEYYSMCISLAFGSLNDVVGNIKSSVGLCALIWIVKALAVNRMQQRNADKTHPTDCETDQWIFDQRQIASFERFSAEISFFLHAQTAFVSGTNTCTMSGMYESTSHIDCMYNLSKICRKRPSWEYMQHIFPSCKWEQETCLRYMWKIIVGHVEIHNQGSHRAIYIFMKTAIDLHLAHTDRLQCQKAWFCTDCSCLHLCSMQHICFDLLQGYFHMQHYVNHIFTLTELGLKGF